MQKHVVPKLEGVVDEEKKISHEKLAEEAEDIFRWQIKGATNMF